MISTWNILKWRHFLGAFKAKGKHKCAQLEYLIPLKSRGLRFTRKKPLKGQILMVTTI